MFVSYQKLRLVGLTPTRWRVSREVLLLVHGDSADFATLAGGATLLDGEDLLFFDVPVTISDGVASDWSLDTQIGISIVGQWPDRRIPTSGPATAAVLQLFGSYQPATMH